RPVGMTAKLRVAVVERGAEARLIEQIAAHAAPLRTVAREYEHNPRLFRGRRLAERDPRAGLAGGEEPEPRAELGARARRDRGAMLMVCPSPRGGGAKILDGNVCGSGDRVPVGTGERQQRLSAPC